MPSISYSRHHFPPEQVFPKLKAPLRKAAARTKEVLWLRIGALLEQFSPDECANDFANAGYELV
jgi:hypothetical protein